MSHLQRLAALAISEKFLTIRRDYLFEVTLVQITIYIFGKNNNEGNYLDVFRIP